MAQHDISDSFQNGIDKLFSFIPEILGFILLIVVGWIVAALVKKLTIRVLRKLRFERAVTLSPAGNMVTRVIEHPTVFVGKLAYWIIFLAFLSFAFSSLNVPALSQMISGIYSYIPNIIAAVLIFLVASAITAGAETFVAKVLRNNPLSKVIAAIIPALTFSTAAFMILNQLQIAKDIVNIAYATIMASIGLGLALAFGLGGRDVASRILTQAYDTTAAKSDDIKAQARQLSADTKGATRQARARAEDAAS